ncbi:hypothetical protein KNP414_05843 [Paenibacillus mucilaginosus KNP414]|uniref:Uncharacterized protein n=1 Tax=Paenibacillus mucilaginosus (strain KNP414) TaxID=1036673 RepID=F8F9N8_PAEMK|nr:hypothetical protein KNP414_05843 [Paenibacillus mucilaginosus KNP414]
MHARFRAHGAPSSVAAEDLGLFLHTRYRYFTGRAPALTRMNAFRQKAI